VIDLRPVYQFMQASVPMLMTGIRILPLPGAKNSGTQLECWKRPVGYEYRNTVVANA